MYYKLKISDPVKNSLRKMKTLAVVFQKSFIVLLKHYYLAHAFVKF